MLWQLSWTLDKDMVTGSDIEKEDFGMVYLAPFVFLMKRKLRQLENFYAKVIAW